ncbi:MAG: FAD/NAD(P)-binding protein [Thermodesulfovibrionales bacterium]|nr:FAD/NAD(P)-binding protein [Thermodesulfovibrionales bacterium]
MHDKSIPFEAKIKWIKKETRDTATYALQITDKFVQKKYKFKPGQFNMLYVPAIGEAPISISSASSDHDLMHTIRIAGDVTTHISSLSTGSAIGIRGPFGNGWPLSEIKERDLMIIGGGLGIAPLRSVIREIVKTKDIKRRNVLLYGAKTPKDIIFRDEYPRYSSVFEVHLTVDKADPEEYWHGDVGLITGLLNKVSFNPINTMFFICGPEVMMQNTVKMLTLKNVPAERIFISIERNMNCGMGICGHCFFGPKFVCKNGPVFRFSEIAGFLWIKEI